MFKLLPDEIKEKVRREYVFRRTVVVTISLLIVLLVAVVGIIPSFLLIKMEERESEERVASIGGLEPNEEVVTLRTWIRHTNLRLSLLDSAHDMDRPGTLIKAVLDEKINGIQISEIGWVKSGAITISGLASDRQTLLDFEAELNDSGKFGTVNLPISNLAKTGDIPFQVVLTPKPAS